MSEKDIVAWLDSLGCEELNERMKAIDTDQAFDQFLRGVFGEEGEVCGPARRIKCVLDPGFVINQQGVVQTISPQAPPGINVGLAIKEFKPPAGEGVDPPAHLEWLVKSRAPYEVIFAAMPMAASLVQSRGWISLRAATIRSSHVFFFFFLSSPMAASSHTKSSTKLPMPPLPTPQIPLLSLQCLHLLLPQIPPLYFHFLHH
jgi:hypothetical protein